MLAYVVGVPLPLEVEVADADEVLLQEEAEELLFCWARFSDEELISFCSDSVGCRM